MTDHLVTSAAWPETADAVIGGDQAVAFAHVTPASGTVLQPLTNTGLRNPGSATMTPVTSSIGAWRKLAQIGRNPRVAIAYHSREHGFSDLPYYVLVQGRASAGELSDRGWIERNRETWERFLGPRDVGLWGRHLRIYHWRVPIEIAVERVFVWPELGCRGRPEVHGAPIRSEPPAPQTPPKKGVAPRINQRAAARRARRLPNVMVGWVDADGFPYVVPVEVGGADGRGIVLDVPAGVGLPPGGRRAGFLAHSFARYTFGQHKRQHTGWLEAERDGRRAVYAPHTESGYHLPHSRFLYRLAAGYVTRRGYRAGLRSGFMPR